MNRRPVRPPPRTLADPPRSLTRAPQATGQRPIFPSLAAVLAGGVVLPACQDPACGPTRADEINRHGPQGLRALHNGDAPNTLREIGLALGLVDHGGDTQVHAAGAVPALTPDPPIAPAGGVMPVSPTPPPPQPPLPPSVPHPREIEGGPRRVVPHPPQPPPVRPGGLRAVNPHTNPAPADLIDGAIPRKTR